MNTSPMEMLDRRRENIALFCAQYGADQSAIELHLARVERERQWIPESRWERLRLWWRYIGVARHDGCGGIFVEVGTSGLAVLRVHFLCSRCGAASYISSGS